MDNKPENSTFPKLEDVSMPEEELKRVATAAREALSTVLNDPTEALRRMDRILRMSPKDIPTGEVRGSGGEAFCQLVSTGSRSVRYEPMPSAKFFHAGRPNRRFRKAVKMASRFMAGVVNQYGTNISGWPPEIMGKVAIETSILGNGKSIGIRP